MKKWLVIDQANRRGFILTLILALIMMNACAPARKDLLAKAATLQEAGDVDAARQIYQGILERHPYEVDAILGMVQITRSEPASGEHNEWCRRLLQLRPWDRYANIMVGKDLMNQGDLKNAVVRFYAAYLDSDFAQEKREVLALLDEVHVKEQERFQNKAEN